MKLETKLSLGAWAFIAVLIALLFITPQLASAQDAATPEAVAIATDTPPTAQPAQISVVVEQPASTPAVASTDNTALIVVVMLAVAALVIAVLRNPTVAGVTSAVEDLQRNRGLVEALENGFQGVPTTAKEALNTTLAILRLINGFLNNPAITQTIKLLEDIETPGLPPEYHAQVAANKDAIERNAADIADIKAAIGTVIPDHK